LDASQKLSGVGRLFRAVGAVGGAQQGCSQIIPDARPMEFPVVITRNDSEPMTGGYERSERGKYRVVSLGHTRQLHAGMSGLGTASIRVSYGATDRSAVGRPNEHAIS
jgi:hypothetical protein